MIIQFTYHREPVPAQRARSSRNGHHYTPQKYRDYKDNLAAALRVEFSEISNELRMLDSKERAKRLKKDRYWFTLKVYRSKDTGDIDNYAKSAIDSLQDAGLILNDKQIISCDIRLEIDKQNPRIALALGLLK